MIYSSVSLKNLLDEVGRDATKNILSNFSCPLNLDVEQFIRQKAIPYELAGMARTYLIMAQFDTLNPIGICAIYSITTKSIYINQKMTRSARKLAFGTTYAVGNPVNAILIGQLSKNYFNNLNELISGEQIMSIIIDKIKEIDVLIPSVSVYIECEDKEQLKKYYEKFEFQYFAKSNDNLLQYIIPTKKLVDPEYIKFVLQYQK